MMKRKDTIMFGRGPTTRRKGTIGTCDRYVDALGQFWKLSRKGWRIVKPKKKR